MDLPRIMIAAPSSGSGKTVVTCGLLQALTNRKKKVMSFKCGPDYIDPMFHSRIIGTPSCNLDTFFTDRGMVRYLFGRRAAKADLSVMEGVMGFYDGLAGTHTEASSWDLADATDTPVILVVNARGMSLSVVSLIRGFLKVPGDISRRDTEHSDDKDWLDTVERSSHIRGVILNRISPSVYPMLKRLIEEELPLKVLGYLPQSDDCVIESRHLGLVKPDEIADLKKRVQHIAEVMEQTLDLDAILRLAQGARPLEISEPDCVKNLPFRKKAPVRIAVAKDEAFCFYYRDNLELLERLGAELICFSPLRDTSLPADVQGLLLGGGYPELYAKQLSENDSMRTSIRTAIRDGLPCLAECGGFMYLHSSMENMEGHSLPMAGVLNGQAYRTKRLGRFGYITLTQNEPQSSDMFEGRIRGHEFHYFDSTDCGKAFCAQKPFSSRSWDCIRVEENLVAGFPHLYYYSNPAFAVRFLQICEQRT